ncbi:hypothetical protein J2I47_02555 [Fibrella sp. HMF5335]|uniref:Por secretion system C-terminal sorting domain-containing protein n=1 Tax=Fibrella rubiginis TaxID=2817060 RepID=A0A939GDA5_9BACT|nr:hypothetical protein [Fibrella rubiginis]MBO0935420.1 hypothetical protein [Fibrella rubiginis]
MKTLIKLLLALSLGLSLTMASLAAPVGIIHPKTAVAYKTGVYVNASGKLNVALNKETGGNVSVVLKNTKGDILFAHTTGKNEQAYRVRLSLDQLPDGTYTIEFSNGFETTQQTVTLSTSAPAVVQRVIMTDGVARTN